MALNFSHLNAHQRSAVVHPSGPLLILAGAGSGKTSTMAYRIAHLISERHITGDSILGLSFTNKAATELKDRVKKLVSAVAGRKATRGLTITTFHSLCARLLRAHAPRLGFQTNFTILDQNDQTDVLRQVLRNIRIDDRRFDPDVILFEIGQAKNRFMGPEQAETFFLESKRLNPDYALAAASAFGKYQEHLKMLNGMDFDDLIYYTVQLLEKEADIRDQYNYQFRHILVDEYQDTNAAQFKIIKLLTEKQQNLCVVGDDDQSIYAWRGADPSHILEFKRHYPAAEVVALEQNYRSTSKILEAANKVIEKNRNRYPKKLWSERGEGEALVEVVLDDDRAEADFLGEEILRRTKDFSRPWGDFAVLYRSNSQSRVFEEALRRRTIPYKIVGGLSFLARKEVKDVLSYWRLIVNPSDDASLRRILNWPARGIGKTSIETLSTYAFENSIPIFKAIQNREALASRLQSKALHAINGFRELIEGLDRRLAATDPTPEALSIWAKESLERINAKRAIEEESDDPVQAARKWENVEELIHSLGQSRPVDVEEQQEINPGLEPGAMMEVQTESISAEGRADIGADVGQAKVVNSGALVMLRDFLNRMSLDAQEAEKDQEKNDENTKKNQVTLLTLHGAKGLEFPVVFLVGMEEGFLPHKRTLDEVVDLSEERRLCYVGITRAKDHLFLLRTKNRIRYGKPVPRVPSRFLEEIPKELMVKMDESGTPEPSSAGGMIDVQKEHENRVKNYLAEIRANLMKS